MRYSSNDRLIGEVREAKATPSVAEDAPKSNQIADTAATDKTEEKPAVISKKSAVILILALGVHSLFEGIAFGL